MKRNDSLVGRINDIYIYTQETVVVMLSQSAVKLLHLSFGYQRPRSSSWISRMSLDSPEPGYQSPSPRALTSDPSEDYLNSLDLGAVAVQIAQGNLSLKHIAIVFYLGCSGGSFWEVTRHEGDQGGRRKLESVSVLRLGPYMDELKFWQAPGVRL